MLVGTLGAFFLPVLVSDGTSTEAEQQQKALEEYQKQLAEQQKTCPTAETTPTEAISPAPTPPEAPSGEDIAALRTVDVTVGDGEEVKAGDCVELLFHGTLASDGKAFQGGSNYAEGKPYRSLTTGFVPGFAEGLVGMRVGGERQIFIPSDKGYGEQAQGDIPANADLIFAVRVSKIYKAQ